LALLLSFVGSSLLAPDAHAQKGCGDVNKSGQTDSVDAAIILQLDAGLFDPGVILLSMWDPSDDGDIDSIDALLVLQYDAGIIDSLDGCYGPAPTPTQLPI
jgi:hypothetical protein